MKEFNKSTKLEHVVYDSLGPRLEEVADACNGEKILRLNTGNPKLEFGFTAPDEVIHDLIMNKSDSEGYSTSVISFCSESYSGPLSIENIPNADIDDVHLGNGVGELITFMQGLLDNGDEVLVPDAGLFNLDRSGQFSGRKCSSLSL